MQINSVITDASIDSYDAIDKLKDVKYRKNTHNTVVTKHILSLGIKAVIEKHEALLKHWKEKIGKFNLNIKLSRH